MKFLITLPRVHHKIIICSLLLQAQGRAETIFNTIQHRIIILTTALSFFSSLSFAQLNCNIYKEDEACHEACLESQKAIMHYSGDEYFQKHFLKAIELCPDFDFSYFELSVNYAKRGLMHEWIKLIDKAVALAPQKHLGWRGWYHWFFMHNYEKAIADIDSLDAITKYDIGTTGDGLYHLNILKGLCYKGLGDTEKAVELIEACMMSEEYYQNSYDYLHLGVLYLELEEPEKALKAFDKQNSYNEISEGYYYAAKAQWQLGNVLEVLDLLELAQETYENGKAMQDPYRQLPDEIYQVDIEKALKEWAGKGK